MTRLAVAMPMDGPLIHREVQHALNRLVESHDRMPWIDYHVDVSRARDRVARVFLHEPFWASYTHLLWWDDDVLPPDVHVVRRMLATGHDVIGCPYPRKKYPLVWPYRAVGPDGGTKPLSLTEPTEVDAMPFGFMLTSRACLERMWNGYHSARWYIDLMEREMFETVGMFDLLYSDVRPGPDGNPHRVKLSEDYSFCASWKAIGGSVYMHPEPCGHIGSHVYAGGLGDLVHVA